MAKQYGYWKGPGGLSPRSRLPKSPRKPRYNQPLAVNEVQTRRREGTRRWSFVIKSRKRPDLPSGGWSPEAAKKRISVRARYIKALDLKPIPFRGSVPLDLLLRWKLPDLADILAPLDRIFDPGSSLPDFSPLSPVGNPLNPFDGNFDPGSSLPNWDPFTPDPGNPVTDPGSSLPDFPTWTFPEDSDDPLTQTFVFAIPRILFNPPQLTSPFLPSMTPMVIPARVLVPEYEPLDLQPLTFEPLPDQFEPGTFVYNPTLTFPAEPPMNVHWYEINGWTRTSEIRVYQDNKLVFLQRVRTDPLRDEVAYVDPQLQMPN